MTTLFLVFCYLSGFAATVGLAFLAWMCAVDSTERLVTRLQDQGAEKAKKLIYNQIITDSWWFSQSKEANEAMKIYGQNQLKGSSDISSIREEWRKAVAGAKDV